MARKISSHQILVLGTAFLALFIFVAMILYESIREPLFTQSPTSHPSVGTPTAKVEIVVFEDFLCSGCRVFHEHIFSKIRSRYIESGDASCRFVPLGFLEGSKPLANAALAVYRLSPDRFYAYESALFEQFKKQPIDERIEAVLLEIATWIGGIDREELRSSIQTKQYYEEIDRNLGLARTMMGKKFRLPAIYVNGTEGSTRDLQALEALIEEKL